MSDEKSTVELVEPRMVRITLRGKVEGDALGTLIDEFEPAVRGERFWAIEADMREVTEATPEARRIGADRLARLPPFSMAVVTTGFAQRMIAKLVLTAVQMFKPGHLDTKTFGDSDSAKDWLRQRLAEHP